MKTCWLVMNPLPLKILRLLRSFKSHSWIWVKRPLYYYRQNHIAFTAFKQNPQPEINRAKKVVKAFFFFTWLLFSTTIPLGAGGGGGGYYLHLIEFSFLRGLRDLLRPRSYYIVKSWVWLKIWNSFYTTKFFFVN